MTDKQVNNSRVTTRQFYEALLRQNDRMDTMEQRIIARIDKQDEKYATKSEVSILRKRIWGGEFVVGGLIVIASTISTLLGRK